MSDRIHVLAKAELQRTEWKLMRALERILAGPEWCDWRDEIRRLVRANEGVSELPPEPPFGVGAGFGERVEIPVEVIREVTVEVPGPERIVEVVREVHVPAPAPEVVEHGPDAPIPDALAVLVPNDVEAAKQKAWITARYWELHTRVVDTTGSFENLSAAETAELNQLERYRGWFS